MDEKKAQAPIDLLHQVIQIGIVTPDLDKSIEGMRQVYDLEPDFVKECRYPSMQYRGEETNAFMKIASYSYFGVRLEFMEPMGEGAMMQKDFLKESPMGHALHHIRFNDVEDNDELTALLAERGVEIYQEGASVTNPGGKFTFYDTIPQLGFVTEVVTAKRE